MNKYKFMSIMMMLVMGISMASCGGDDKNDDDSYLEENGGGSGSNNTYSYDDFVGHWVNEEQWDYCMYVISFIESRPCYYITTYTDNYDLQNGVGGFYIAYGKKAYGLWITVSDRKYDNNPVAGNRPIRTWCVNGEYAYFLNVESTKYNERDILYDYEEPNKVYFNKTTFTLQSPTKMVDHDGIVYVKKNL